MNPLTADLQGFSLNASVACTTLQRNTLERLACFVAHPAIALEHLTVDAAGRLALELTDPFRDGTSLMLLPPEDWLRRLAALVPRPRAHLARYQRAIAPNCRLRARVVPSTQSTATRIRRQTKVQTTSRPPGLPALNDDGPPIAPLNWAERMQRVFQIDITTCIDCGLRTADCGLRTAMYIRCHRARSNPQKSCFTCNHARHRIAGHRAETERTQPPLHACQLPASAARRVSPWPINTRCAYTAG
jgi:hypothetical protein